MIVAIILENLYSCNFTDGEAKVVDKDGHTVRRLRHEKGIVVSRMELRSPTPPAGLAEVHTDRPPLQDLQPSHSITPHADVVMVIYLMEPLCASCASWGVRMRRLHA